MIFECISNTLYLFLPLSLSISSYEYIDLHEERDRKRKKKEEKTGGDLHEDEVDSDPGQAEADQDLPVYPVKTV